ncbi:hypothetical protein AALP_AA4G117200 [Arabis alpina]|uniref:Uncharacterized protein n=1 Tax=Arabis alpina TaxID=50452 RepID=A0A087H2N5_ARAAL|nr:hypothetical protein AALP_AA4G117200 [Arabis alpina]
MASSVTILALNLILIFHLTPETTASGRLNDQKSADAMVTTTTDEAKTLPFPPGLPFGGVPPLPLLFPPFPFKPSPFPGNVPPLPSLFPPFPFKPSPFLGNVPPFPFPLPSSPLPFLTPTPP